MIPDKLYLSPVIYGAVTNLSPNPDCEGEFEYVRKEALLKFMNDRLKEAREQMSTDKVKDRWTFFNCGREDALISLVNFINSL